VAGKLLYEDDQGRIGKVFPGQEGTYLAGGLKMQWRQMDATSVPYTSRESGPLPNVSVALDQALLMIQRLQTAVVTLEESNAKIDVQQNDMLAALRMEVAELNRFFQETATRVNRASHQKTTASISSNTALTLDANTQTVSLNLAAKGSFDDSRAGLGVNSIQLALEALAAKQKELTYTVSALQDGLSRLQKTVQSQQGEF